MIATFAWVMILVDGVLFLERHWFNDRFWDVMDYLTNLGDSPPHSLFTMQRYETPYYSWLH
jgi:hypothetical protein